MDAKAHVELAKTEQPVTEGVLITATPTERALNKIAELHKPKVLENISNELAHFYRIVLAYLYQSELKIEPLEVCRLEDDEVAGLIRMIIDKHKNESLWGTLFGLYKKEDMVFYQWQFCVKLIGSQSWLSKKNMMEIIHWWDKKRRRFISSNNPVENFNSYVLDYSFTPTGGWD